MKNYICSRAIILKEDNIVVMERLKNGKHYYALPGGHIEKDESNEECVVREVKEEFNINVLVQKHLYDHVLNNEYQAYYLCRWIDGQISKTDGEEYRPDRNRGMYNPVTISLFSHEAEEIVPREIVEQIIKDYRKNDFLTRKLKTFKLKN